MEVTEHTIDFSVPTSDVKMLLYQPFVKFESEDQEPFCLSRSRIQKYESSIRRVFDCAKSVNPSFVVLPEYSVPGLTGVQLIDDAMRNAEFPNNTIVIAGVDGLSKADYEKVVESFGDSCEVAEANRPESVSDTEWVNCSITWLKSIAGSVSVFIQPKVTAAWPEENASFSEMFRGRSMNLYRAKFSNGVALRFASFLCYDWIGRDGDGHQQVPKQFLNAINEQWRPLGDPKQFHLAFLLQHNPKPNHYTFTSATREFLVDSSTYPFVDRSGSAVIVVSTAAAERPTRKGLFGFTSIVFSPSAPVDCNVRQAPPSITVKPKRLDATRDLGTCKDIVFREMGECIHTCSVRMPSFVTLHTTDRKRPVTAEIHPIETSNDARLPCASVPAATKWIQDELDEIEANPLSDSLLAHSSFVEAAIAAEGTTTTAMRCFDGKSSEEKIRLCSPTASMTDVDDWDQEAGSGLEHVWNSVVLISTTTTASMENASLHAAVGTEGTDIVAIKAGSHQLCREHFESFRTKSHGPVLVVTRDDHNSVATEAELTKFYETNSAGIKLIDYATLLSSCQGASNEDDFRKFITELIDVGERKII